MDAFKKILIGFLLSLIMIEHIHAAEREISISVGEWPPYISEYVANNGMLAEIVNSAFAEVGIKTNLKFYPWKRSLLIVKKSGVSASFPWAKRSKRELYAKYSNSLFSQGHSFFYIKDNFKNIDLRSVDEIKKYTIGIPMGYSYVSELINAGYNCKIISSSSNGIIMLLKKHIDFLFESDEVGRYLVKALLPDRIYEFGEIKAPFAEESVYLIMPKGRTGSDELLLQFNKGLQEIKKDGTYDSIIRKYRGND